MRVSNSLRSEARLLVARRLGLDFPANREAEFDRGLLEAVRLSRSDSPEAYLGRLATGDRSEWGRLASLLIVGETYFFRDRPCFDALEQRVLPALIKARRLAGTQFLRLWSAACATGEEAYSLAILVDQLLPDRTLWDVTVLATDLDPMALEKAGRATYREWSLRDVSPAVRDRYFEGGSSGAFDLVPKIRAMVSFEPGNLAEGLPRAASSGSMDIILCRNVLMYFTPEATKAVVSRLQTALAEGGWLVVAPAEAFAQRFRPLVTVNFPQTIFFRKGDGPGSSIASPPQASPKPIDLRSVPARAPAKSPSRRPAAPLEEKGEPLPPAAVLLAGARGAADGGDLEEALRLCRAAIAKDRLDAEAHRLLAAIHQERGDVAAAVPALRRAVYLDPDCAQAHLALGLLLVRRGQRRHGLKHLETAARLGESGEVS
ncbi:MAG TPA: CheR family methyltransferase [Vicinamibacteria bacterium]|nr:CheR family methyltransferase [Vicinamibacteria bacterium]